MMLVLGVVLSIPASLMAAWAPSVSGWRWPGSSGGAAGMAYPTTLAIITALWTGAQRTKSIALWSGIGGAVSALGPLVAGAALEEWWWGVRVPPDAAHRGGVALVMAVVLIPSHVNETTDPVDNLGGVLSVVLVAAVVLGINCARARQDRVAVGLATVALAATAAFIIRQRRTRYPLYDLKVAGRRIFWVAALAGIIVFGALMGAMFIGQQFLQNVHEYSSVEAGAAIPPAAVFMVLVALRGPAGRAAGVPVHAAGRLRGGALGFVTMLVLGREQSLLAVGLAYALWASASAPRDARPLHSPPPRPSPAGMASGTADLQRDWAACVMQSILGALLAGLHVGDGRPGVGAAQQPPAHRRRESQLTSRSAAGPTWPSSTPVLEPDHRRGASRSSTGRTGPTSPGSSQ